MTSAKYVVVLGLLALSAVSVKATCPIALGCAGKSSSYCTTDLVSPLFNSLCSGVCCLSSGVCGYPTILSKCAGSGGTSGDPIFSGFEGSTFEFMGQPFTYWNIVSERSHQINAYFTPAQLFDHNGTYISAFGIQYDIHNVAVRVQDDGSLDVDVNGVRLSMAEHETANTVRLSHKHSSAGNMTVEWQLYAPGTGHTVEITTPMLTYKIYSVRPGTVDEGGLVQPAYLDSTVTLTSAPAMNKMTGVLGETYTRLVDNLTRNKASSTERYTVDPAARSELKVTGLFDNDFEGNLYSSPHGANRRELAEAFVVNGPLDSRLVYPITASTAGL